MQLAVVVYLILEQAGRRLRGHNILQIHNLEHSGLRIVLC